MKAKWLAEVFALVISATSTVPLEGSPPASNPIIQEVESSYKEGAYDTFLKQLDEQYRKAGQAGALRGVFESAKNATKDRVAPPKAIDPERVKKQTQERNQRLLDAIAENPDLEIVQKVDRVVFSAPTQQQEALLRELDSLKYEVPETAHPTLKNKISALETEYYIKSLLLDVGNHKSKSSLFELKKKKLALSFEKFDKMHELTKDFLDSNWEQKITAAKEAFLAQSSYRDSLQDLEALAQNASAPKNSVEEKIKDIMMEYSTLH